MEGWKQVKLGEVVDLKQGFAVNKKSNHYISDDGIPLLKISDLINNTETLFVRKDIPKQFLVYENEIIYSRTGQVGLVFMGRKGVVYNNCFKVIPKEIIDSKFLYSLLNEPHYRNVARSLATGAAQPDLNHAAFKSIKIQLPPLPIQKKIAGILSAYDDLIENNLKRIKLLEEMAQITYEEWFVRLRFPGHETTPINPKAGLPEEWEEGTLNNFCSKITDGTHDSPKQVEEGRKLITGKHILNGFIDFETAYLISEEDHLKIKKRSGLGKGDILFSNIGTLGNMAVVTQDFEFSCKNVIIFKRKDGYHNFLYTYLSNQNTRNKLFGQSAGVAQKFFSLKFVRTYKDFFPPNHLVEKFDDYVGELYKTKVCLHEQNQSLREARDILLPRLMTGVIDVEQYNPADLLKEVA